MTVEEQTRHETYMRRCIELGIQALQQGNPPVGSLLVINDHIISEASETARTTGDVTDHAEIIVLRKALHQLQKDQWATAILYSTHEPCVMCGYAIRHYGLKQVVFGCPVPHAGAYTSKYAILCEDDHPSWKVRPIITEGILQQQCMQLTEAWKTYNSNRG
jgi:tRNA(adenine34) deaminase